MPKYLKLCALSSAKTLITSPSRQLDFPRPPDLSVSSCTVETEEVVQAISSFHSGSAAGLDGISPAHLKELTSSSAGDNEQKLLECLTQLCNYLLSGKLNPEVCPFLYGAALYQKKTEA